MRSLLKNTLATACAAAALATAAVPATAQTLSFVSWQVDDGGMGDWWRAAIDRFEAEHPGVTIDFTKVERASYADTMTTLFAGGQPPHIVHLASFEYQIFADRGWMENLDPWIERDGLDLSDWAGQQTCVWKGDTACIMLLYFGFMMAYNPELLAAAGVDVPTNWDEFLAAAQATTLDLNGDGITDQFGTGHETRGGAGQYLTEMLNYMLDAGAYWTDGDGNVTIDTPEMVEALSRWRTVIEQGLTPVDMSAGEVRTLFADGGIALRLDGPWLYGTIRQGAAADVIEIAAPPFDPPVGGSSNVLGMASEISDEEKELVWDFIRIAMSDEFQRTYATVAGNTPPSPAADLTGVEESVPHFPIIVATQQAAAAAGVDRIPTGLELVYAEFGRMVQEEVQRMLIEDLDPAQAAATMQARAEEIQGR